jgi:hypothetical protein
MTGFPVPEGVPSAVTLPELRLLQRYAHEAGTILEIGTHYGFTCIGMALAGAHVTSVDPHFEGPADAPDTWEPFLANVERHGFEPRSCAGDEDACYLGRDDTILAYRVPVESRQSFLPIGWRGFGLVFIDGNHTWPCPWRDAEIAMAHLVPGGYIAFHDVTPRWPGVWRAAGELASSGWDCVASVGTLAVYQKSASGTSGASSTPAVHEKLTEVRPDPPIRK